MDVAGCGPYTVGWFRLRSTNGNGPHPIHLKNPAVSWFKTRAGIAPTMDMGEKCFAPTVRVIRRRKAYGGERCGVWAL